MQKQEIATCLQQTRTENNITQEQLAQYLRIDYLI